MKFVNYFFVYLRSVPWNGPRETFIEHQKYLQWLDQSGYLLLAGPLEDGAGGLLFLDVKTIEKAQELANGDPYVKAGKYEVEIHPVSFPVTRDLKILQKGIIDFEWIISNA